VSEQHEEESLRRASREQAEIERQTDALVLRTLTAMVTAAEDLKSKLRRDTEDVLENYRRTKRSLENEISLAGAERQRLRRDAEDERDGLLERARETADQIVADAESERESLLAEVRVMEQRLRGLESQIRAALGLGTDDPPRAVDAPVGRMAPAPAPASAAPEPEPEPEPEPAFVASFSPPVVEQPLEPEPAPAPASADDDAVTEDESATPAPGATSDAMMSDEDLQAALAAVLEAPTAPILPPAVEFPPAGPLPQVAPARPAPLPPVRSSAPAPAPMPTPAPAPVPAPTSQPVPSGPRPVRLIFDGVPGYQQAAVLEQAVSDLMPHEEVDIEEFEQGQLVLTVTVSDLPALAEQLVAASPASLALEGVSGDSATFRYV
jgi:hypothetical protein